jgi:uncharacterized protein
MAQQLNIKNVAYGANMDDLSDFRPGHKAAREHRVLSPLQTAELSKPEIRELAQLAGLPSWDRPQAACLSSRFPTFEIVTAPGLSRVDAAERFIHSLGFKQIRVRNHTLAASAVDTTGDVDVLSNGQDKKEVLLARLEVEHSEFGRFSDEPALFSQIDAELKRLGYQFVTLDLGGYKQGSGNILLAKAAAETKTQTTMSSSSPSPSNNGANDG